MSKRIKTRSDSIISRINTRKDQETFKCTTCGHIANADWNEARNIAMDGIESIIKAQCKSQGLPI